MLSYLDIFLSTRFIAITIKLFHFRHCYFSLSKSGLQFDFKFCHDCSISFHAHIHPPHPNTRISRHTQSEYTRTHMHVTKDRNSFQCSQQLPGLPNSHDPSRTAFCPLPSLISSSLPVSVAESTALTVM